MMFDDEFLEALQSKDDFQVEYISGHLNNNESRLTDFKVTEAKDSEMFIQLTFSNPIYVAAGESFCQIKVHFGDGTLFKSAGYGVQLEQNTEETKYLERQLN